LEAYVSITVIFRPNGVTTGQYDEMLRRLDAAGAGSPPGREYHTCFGAANSVGVVDVWTSLEQFQAFGAVLMPIIADIGAPVAEPEIHDTYNVIPS
jgi:hypothetical protein